MNEEQLLELAKQYDALPDKEKDRLLSLAPLGKDILLGQVQRSIKQHTGVEGFARGTVEQLKRPSVALGALGGFAGAGLPGAIVGATAGTIGGRGFEIAQESLESGRTPSFGEVLKETGEAGLAGAASTAILGGAGKFAVGSGKLFTGLGASLGFGTKAATLVEEGAKRPLKTLTNVFKSKPYRINDFILRTKSKMRGLLDFAETRFGQAEELVINRGRRVSIDGLPEVLNEIKDVAPNASDRIAKIIIGKTNRLTPSDFSTEEAILIRKTLNEAFSEMRKFEPAETTFRAKEAFVRKFQGKLVENLQNANPELKDSGQFYKETINFIQDVNDSTGVGPNTFVPTDNKGNIISGGLLREVRDSLERSLSPENVDVFKMIRRFDPEVANDILETSLYTQIGKGAVPGSSRIAANVALGAQVAQLATRNPALQATGTMASLQFPRTTGLASGLLGLAGKAVKPSAALGGPFIREDVNNVLLQELLKQ